MIFQSKRWGWIEITPIYYDAPYTTEIDQRRRSRWKRKYASGWCLGVGFYDLLTLVRVYWTQCDGHAAPASRMRPPLRTDVRRKLTHPWPSPIDRSPFFLPPSLRLLFRFLTTSVDWIIGCIVIAASSGNLNPSSYPCCTRTLILGYYDPVVIQMRNQKQIITS